MKKIISFMLCLILMPIISGCYKEQNKGDNEVDNINGTLCIWTSSEMSYPLKATAENFKKKHLDLDIIIKEITDTTVEKALIKAKEKGEELPDAALINGSKTDEFFKGFDDVLEVDSSVYPEIDNNTVLYKLSEITGDNNYMAVPWTIRPVVIYYRRDIIEKLGISMEDIKTWDDYIEVGKKLKNATKGKTKLLGMLDNEVNFYKLLLNQLGIGYFDNNDNITIDESESIQAIMLMRKFNEFNLIKTGLSKQQLIDNIKTDQVALVLLGYDFNLQFEKILKEQSGKWGVIKLPAFEPGGRRAASKAGDNLIIIKSTKNKTAAEAFIEYLIENNEVQINNFKDFGILPANTSFYKFQIVNEGVSYFQNDKLWRLLYDSANETARINYNQTYEDIDKILIKHKDIFNIHKSLIEELEKIKFDINTVINEQSS